MIIRAAVPFLLHTLIPEYSEIRVSLSKRVYQRRWAVDRQIRNIISHTRATAPQWVAELDLARNHRLRRTAYEIKQT